MSVLVLGYRLLCQVHRDIFGWSYTLWLYCVPSQYLRPFESAWRDCRVHLCYLHSSCHSLPQNWSPSACLETWALLPTFRKATQEKVVNVSRSWKFNIHSGGVEDVRYNYLMVIDVWTEGHGQINFRRLFLFAHSFCIFPVAALIFWFTDAS